MKKIYEVPELKIEKLEIEDIIASGGEVDNQNPQDC